MNTKEKPNDLKKETEHLCGMSHELTAEELGGVVGGAEMPEVQVLQFTVRGAEKYEDGSALNDD